VLEGAVPEGAVLEAAGTAGAVIPAIAVPASRDTRRDARTERLLTAPVLPLLLRLAAPNLLVMLVQSSVGLIETYWIGRLGTEALAGVTLVFPALMLMQMMSAGAMGGGIASSIARALGARRREEADALASHAVIIAGVLGLIFMVAALLGGPSLYARMGGTGPALRAALTYSNTVFAGIILLWVFNALASILRGTGNMALPAAVTTVGAVILVPLSPALIFGWGPFPQLGVAGGGAAVVLYYGIGGAVLLARLLSGAEVVRPPLAGLRLRQALFWEILRVGAIAALVTVTTNVTVAFTTGLVGQSGGTAAIAGYGAGARLEYLLIPLSFGIGAPLVALVGTNIAAGRHRRALQAAWLGAGISAALAEAIGLVAAGHPAGWIGLFSSEPAVLAAGGQYLRIVGPAYGCFGIGMTLYFASQGAGRMAWPLQAGLLRLVIATLGGYGGAVLLGWGPVGAYGALALGLVAYGLVNAAAVAGGAWSERRSR
jgi:putative MATE family efflux protein